MFEVINKYCTEAHISAESPSRSTHLRQGKWQVRHLVPLVLSRFVPAFPSLLCLKVSIFYKFIVLFFSIFFYINTIPSSWKFFTPKIYHIISSFYLLTSTSLNTQHSLLKMMNILINLKQRGNSIPFLLISL